MKEQINFGVNKPAGTNARPSLQNKADTAHAYDWRILQQLEHGAQPPAAASMQQHWNIEQWLYGLGVLLILICASAWYLHPSPARVTDAAPLPAATPHPLPAPPWSAPAPLTSTNNAATLITSDSADEEASHRPEPAIALLPAPQLTLHEKGLSRKSARPAAAPDRLATTLQADTSGDSDAALLAALVAHGSAGHSGAMAANRDIVERQASDSTSQLLQRCQQLGMIEGMLCRSRICAGRWDNDQACRQPAAMSSASERK